MLGFLSPLYATSELDGLSKTFISLVTFLSFQVCPCVSVYVCAFARAPAF
jgi:hypothetical protein